MLKAIEMTSVKQWDQPIAKMNERHSFISTCLNPEVLYDTNKIYADSITSLRGFGLFQFGRFIKRKYDSFFNPLMT